MRSRFPSLPNPSIVVTLPPSAFIAYVMHEYTASPPRRTVQAPHPPVSHPFFVPVRESFSLNTKLSDIHGSTSTSRSMPFTFIFTLSTLAPTPSPLECSLERRPEEQLGDPLPVGRGSAVVGDRLAELVVERFIRLRYRGCLCPPIH